MCKNSFPSSRVVQGLAYTLVVCDVNIFLFLLIIYCYRKQKQNQRRRQKTKRKRKRKNQRKKKKKQNQRNQKKKQSQKKQSQKNRKRKQNQKNRRRKKNLKRKRRKLLHEMWYVQTICDRYKISPCDLGSYFGRGDENEEMITQEMNSLILFLTFCWQQNIFF